MHDSNDDQSNLEITGVNIKGVDVPRADISNCSNVHTEDAYICNNNNNIPTENIPEITDLDTSFILLHCSHLLIEGKPTFL